MRKLIAIIAVVFFSTFLVLQASPSVMAQSSNSSGNIVVQTIPGQTLAQNVAQRAKNSWPWYIVRGSGFVAAFCLVILMVSGVGLVTGYTFKFLEPLTAWASHRALGIVMAIALLVHMLGLLFDHFVPFDIMSLLVPWISNYKPVTIFGLHLGSLFVALGVLSFYGTVLVVLTSLLWVEKKKRLWKLTHLLSYIVMAFVFVHALFLGTDLAGGPLRLIWIALAICLAAVFLHRLWRAKTV